METMTFRARTACVAIVTFALLTSACTLKDQQEPALTGPSGLSLGISMTASPDSLPRDGRSQAVITLVARDTQGRAVSGQRLSISLGVNAPQGATVSVSEITTNSAGQASFTVTAPSANSIGDIAVVAVPVGSDANNSISRQILIRALPQNNAPPQFPSPPFTMTCSSSTANCVTNPDVGQTVTFDATGVTDEGVSCNSCRFAWDFGDGSGAGQIVSHQFNSGGTFVVTLTVTDSGGLSNTAQRTLDVSSPGPATVDFSSAPTSPVAGQAATFTATATAPANHRIVTYVWSWGDGASQTTTALSVQHVFDAGSTTYPKIYPVTLTVRDDLGQTATVTKPVTVTSGLTPVLTASPSGTVVIGRTIFFDASGSTSSTGSTITTYSFDFGDGTSQTGSSPTAKHEYDTSGTFTVKLTITDDKGRSASTTTLGAGGGQGNIIVTN